MSYAEADAVLDDYISPNGYFPIVTYDGKEFEIYIESYDDTRIERIVLTSTDVNRGVKKGSYAVLTCRATAIM